MKVALSQINPTVGAFEDNLAMILDAIGNARRHGVDLVVFPELAVTGYPPLDLLERKAFINRAKDMLDRIRSASAGIGVIVGFPLPNPAMEGKPLFNAAAVIWDGQVLGVHRKVLLPTYDVFDESRYFEPGPEPVVFDTPVGRLGVTICEDIWNDRRIGGRRLYHNDPMEAIGRAGIDMVINISASPFEQGKIETRLSLAADVALQYKVPVIYVNQVGGNDGLIFDGRSFIMSAQGRLVAMSPAFQPDFLTLDNDAPIQRPDTGKSHDGEIMDALALGLRDYVEKTGFHKVCLGLSGGIDSAVVAAIAVHALGPDRVVAVSMPSAFSSGGTRTDARVLAHNLGIEFHEIPIEQPFNAFLDLLKPEFQGRKPDVTEENLQSRVRGAILMALSNKFGWLVLNTGNKSELAVGYCTLYGDMAGGLAVIGDLPKHAVYSLAREFNRKGEKIPETIITRPPSAELRPDQKDTDSLPDYDLLDRIVTLYMEKGMDADEIKARGLASDVVDRVIHLIRMAEYKRRQAPIALKVTTKAFGQGRIFPIVQRFEG